MGTKHVGEARQTKNYRMRTDYIEAVEEIRKAKAKKDNVDTVSGANVIEEGIELMAEKYLGLKKFKSIIKKHATKHNTGK